MSVVGAIGLILKACLLVAMFEPSIPTHINNVDLNLHEDETAITFFSLTEGEATIIQGNNGENILVNTGGKLSKVELKELLSIYGVDQISTVIITKVGEGFDDNLPWLIEKYDVKQLVYSEAVKETLHLFEDKLGDTALQFWQQGLKKQLLPGVQVEVLFDGSEVNEGMDLSFTLLDHRMLYLTSFGKRVEEVLLSQPLSDVNIIKLPNYAQKNSISKKLLKHLDPQSGIIFHTRDVLPDEDLLTKLHDQWVDLYFTRQHGTITMKFTKLNYEVITIPHDEK